ncbi:HSCB C-terminal oligomerization domain-containing protein [Podospora appendiculata]|uniref:HSCB C-terminal oligomerization domain-containing protein n=1 Tax=Podospora appendiculata TaxID=314037 RepID=A0AAE0XIP4_9PEZI|nr:HSCB C-terminal oligomerization domain-containing protein [Podospora appendiculata]
MRRSILSSSERAAAGLCAACRKEAIGQPRAFATAAAAAGASTAIVNSTRRTTASPDPPINNSTTTTTTAAPRRWLSHSVPRARTTSPAESKPSPASTPAQPPPTPPYYALFPETFPSGAPPTGPFHVDVRALRREFLRLQAASHPDFHHHAAASEQPSETQTAVRRRAEQTSALINAAYKTLCSPLLRAQYLLRERHGVDLEGDEAGAHTAADPAVLMTVLEARERVEDAQAEADLESLRRENEERIAAAEEALTVAFRDGDVQRAKEEAVRLRYWVNIRESVDNWERGKGVVLNH